MERLQYEGYISRAWGSCQVIRVVLDGRVYALNVGLLNTTRTSQGEEMDTWPVNDDM